MFAVSIKLPSDYPWKPPACRFITPVYHPNIAQNGEICLSIFRDEWGPYWVLETSKQKTNVILNSITNRTIPVLTALCSFLGNPDCEVDGPRPDVAREFLHDRYHFDIKARLMTQRFASRGDSSGIHDLQSLTLGDA